MRRRALVSSYYVPQYDRDCASGRIFDFILCLRDAGWDVDFVAANGLGPPAYTKALQRLGVAVHDDSTITADRPSPFESVVRSSHLDLALLVFWPVARYYLPKLRRLSPSTRILVSSEDMHFLRDARRILHPEANRGARPLLDTEFAEHMVEELNTYIAADAVLAVSPKEAELLGEISSGHAQPHVVALADDLPVSPFALSERRGMLMLGSYQHPPNIDAVEYLFGDVLPRVDPTLRALHPLDIVGNGLDASIVRMADGIEHVRLVGWVPSVTPYFHRARITVVPLRYGAGTKGKMVQALMSATPTVCSSIGAEGLALRDGEEVLIGDDAVSFARAIEQLLTDDDLWHRLAANGRTAMLREHTRAAVRQQFLAAVEVTLAAPAKAGVLSEDSLSDYQQRLFRLYRTKAIPAVVRMLATEAPGVRVLIASGGDPAFLMLGDHPVWHFPCGANGVYRDPTGLPGNGLVDNLEGLRAHGASLLVFPRHTWGLLETPVLKNHLDTHYRRLAYEAGECITFDLRIGPETGETDTMAVGSPTAKSGAATEAGASTRLIAFYLPQYHPIAQNDEWWGEGFTDWRNVGKALPLFPGHEQPQLPADLGFYDLRLPEARTAQAELAREFGIDAFCYYHYWFQGRRLLERPFNEVLRSGEPDFPFCLCWANEPWSRRWDGREDDVLQPQAYSPEDDLAHIRWLLEPLADHRAVTIDGKTVFIVYQAQQLPDAARTSDLWRREVERAGLKGLYLIAVETGWDAGWDATQVGFDAKILFQPQFSLLGTPARRVAGSPLRVFDYEKVWPILSAPEPVAYRRFDTVFPSWDNSPRRGNDGWVIHGSTPEQYERWLRTAIERTQGRPADERIVFINAWNEWAEGCHLEPDLKHGLAYLEATRRARGR